jgi:hypothetical protein
VKVGFPGFPSLTDLLSQNEARSKSEEYNQRSRQMHGALEALKAQKGTIRSQIVREASSRIQPSFTML